MNRSFNPTSRWLRSVFAAGSVVVTLAIAAAIGALAEHYTEPTVASMPPAKIAQR